MFQQVRSVWAKTNGYVDRQVERVVRAWPCRAGQFSAYAPSSAQRSYIEPFAKCRNAIQSLSLRLLSRCERAVFQFGVELFDGRDLRRIVQPRGQAVLVTFVEPFETRRGSHVEVVRCGDFVFAAIELVVCVVVDIGVVEDV
jgi:hypothetical protein